MSDVLDQLNRALAERYRVERAIGTGGMATVYLGRDLKYDRQVAIKVIKPEISAAVVAERFLREIQVVARLHHPHILPLFDSGESDDWLYCVVPFIDGESLRTKLSREGELPVMEAMKILRDVADALAHAHAQGFVHCRITPENVMLSKRHAVVTDFGITAAVSSGGHLTTLAGGFVVGTPLYMAPEQVVGDTRVDGRADIYALGVLAYEMLTGRPPFLGTTAEELLSAQVSVTPVAVKVLRDTVPSALDQMVMQCMQKRPADRIQTADAVLSQTERLLSPPAELQPVAKSESTGQMQVDSRFVDSDTSDPLERLKAVLSDRYEIERAIGSGGMAVVFVAQDRKHPRKVAIKVLRPELAAVVGRERFLQEIAMVAALRHPHIMPLYDSGEVGSLLYYVMPFVEGASLREKMNREAQLPVDEAVHITCEVANALGSAHRKKVIHRDIKPENIMFEEGHAIVTDFGIARPMSVTDGARITDEGQSPLTPTYASPEQASGEWNIDGRSDIYSLACVLYEMLAGEPPFEGSTVESVVAKHISATPTPLDALRSTIPPHVAQAVNQALAKAPVDRFDSAEDFVRALNAAEVASKAPGGARGDSADSGSPLVTDVTLEEIAQVDSRVDDVMTVAGETPRTTVWAHRARHRGRVWAVVASVATIAVVVVVGVRSMRPAQETVASVSSDSLSMVGGVEGLRSSVRDLIMQANLDESTTSMLLTGADSSAALLLGPDTGSQYRELFRQRLQILMDRGSLSTSDGESMLAKLDSVLAGIGMR
jgi:serine/threonine protein kinase